MSGAGRDGSRRTLTTIVVRRAGGVQPEAPGSPRGVRVRPGRPGRRVTAPDHRSRLPQAGPGALPRSEPGGTLQVRIPSRE